MDHARFLLQAAGIEHERLGQAFLWDAEGVRKLLGALHGGPTSAIDDATKARDPAAS